MLRREALVVESERHCMINDRIFTTDTPGVSLKAHENGSVSVLLSGRVIVMSADSASKLGGELCHAANAARKLQREAAEAAKRITAADIKAGAAFWHTDGRTYKDVQRTIVQTGTDAFVFVNNQFAMQSPPMSAANLAHFASQMLYRKAR